ncbi:MAG: cysteine--tRNA ligase [bacterium]|nr:cysteine--tRNA ligase [bacterium]
MSIKFYNTLTRQKENFKSIKENVAKMYTCGPTVYNFAHIGNFRAYIFEDILRRTLEYFDYNVIQVMNLTDVDDKTIRDSQAANIPLNDYTKKYKDAFFEDLKNLNIETAEFYPAATDHIKEMIKLIEILVAKKIAYKSDDGSIYFSIAKFPAYGELAKIDMKNQRSVDRVNSDEYEKDSVADFALWKAWSEADGDVVWDSPWGKGRPGWHIECSAMSMKYLGKTFDLHTGGIDNMFPHHEDEIAQSESATGKKFVNYWMHCEYLIVNGDKMSKSLGNFFILKDLIKKGYSYKDIRWVLISAHYRKKLNFTFDGCKHAKETLRSFNILFDNLNSVIKAGRDGVDLEQQISSYAEKFKNAIGDDLNISEALASVFSLMRDANKLISSGELGASGARKILDTYKNFNKILGVFEFEKHVEIPEDIKTLVEERKEARLSKDFAKSDEIRDKLKELGWLIEDTASGARISKI